MGVGTSLLTRCLLLKKREESRFRPGAGGGKWVNRSETGKPQRFNEFGKIHVLSMASREHGKRASRNRIPASMLSGRLRGR